LFPQGDREKRRGVPERIRTPDLLYGTTDYG